MMCTPKNEIGQEGLSAHKIQRTYICTYPQDIGGHTNPSFNMMTARVYTPRGYRQYLGTVPASQTGGSSCTVNDAKITRVSCNK